MIVADEEGHRDEEDHYSAKDDHQHHLIGQPTVHLPVGYRNFVSDCLTLVTDGLEVDIVGGTLGEDAVSDAEVTNVVIACAVHWVAVNFGITSIYRMHNKVHRQSKVKRA